MFQSSHWSSQSWRCLWLLFNILWWLYHNFFTFFCFKLWADCARSSHGHFLIFCIFLQVYFFVFFSLWRLANPRSSRCHTHKHEQLPAPVQRPEQERERNLSWRCFQISDFTNLSWRWFHAKWCRCARDTYPSDNTKKWEAFLEVDLTPSGVVPCQRHQPKLSISSG